jgi:hypothetical protein
LWVHNGNLSRCELWKSQNECCSIQKQIPLILLCSKWLAVAIYRCWRQCYRASWKSSWCALLIRLLQYWRILHRIWVARCHSMYYPWVFWLAWESPSLHKIAKKFPKYLS